MKREEKIKQLRAIIEQLIQHRKGAEFVAQVGRKLGRTLHRNFASRIVDGTISFKNGWGNHLEQIYQVAEQKLEKLERTQEKKRNTFKPQKIIEVDYGICYIEQVVLAADALFAKGDMSTAFEQISNLNRFIKIEEIYRTNPYLYGYFHLVFAKLQMQFGQTKGELGSINLVGKCLTAFEKLPNEKQRLFQSLNLQGHVLRQVSAYKAATAVFKEAQELAQQLPKANKNREKSKMNIQHQLAINYMRMGQLQQDDTYFRQSAKLFEETNTFLADGDDERWYLFSRLREAELYMKRNQLKEAEKYLGIYEDYPEMTLRTNARIAIFYRINAERYLKQKDEKNALIYFKKAVLLNSDEGYKEGLKKLNQLYKQYTLLQKHLPPHFSVYQPIWS